MRATYLQEGSFLRGDLRSAPKHISLELDVESSAPIDAVRAVIQIAHQACFTETLIREPLTVVTVDRVNGETVG